MTRAAIAFLCALVAAAPRVARASPADAFENKVKPVSGQLYTKAGKFELTVPALGLSLNDAFFSKYVIGAKVGYHLSETWSIGATGIVARNSATGSTQVCTAQNGCRPAGQADLDKVPGQIRWVGGLEVGFSPIYGKLNVFGEKAVHFDLSLFLGGDMVAYRDVVRASAPAGTSPGTATSPGAHLGLGARVFIARSMAIRLDVRDVFYSVSNLDRGKLQTQLFAELGLSILLGGSGGR